MDFSDRGVPCAREGCDGKWIWASGERQAAWKKKQTEPPSRICAGCQDRRTAVVDVEVPCRVKGCPRTFGWPRARQLDLGAPFAEVKPPEGMCEAHAKQVKQAQDRKVPCRTPGCTRTWVWNRWQQMEAGSKEDDPAKLDAPQRYCEPCFGQFKAALDQELTCRVKGCSNKWTWSKVQQVRAWHEAGEPADKTASPPERMCNRCSETISKLEDKEVPCRIRSCKNSWKMTRALQLESVVKTKKLPRRLCGPCSSDLSKLADRAEPCKNPGCTGTWTYSRTAQLIAQRRHGSGTPPTPKRTCETCDAFIKATAPTEVVCIGCGTPIHWTSLAQLMTHLGKWVKPSRCPPCAARGVPAPAPENPAAIEPLPDPPILIEEVENEDVETVEESLD